MSNKLSDSDQFFEHWIKLSVHDQNLVRSDQADQDFSHGKNSKKNIVSPFQFFNDAQHLFWTGYGVRREKMNKTNTRTCYIPFYYHE